jgi:hypothetical protein
MTKSFGIAALVMLLAIPLLAILSCGGVEELAYYSNEKYGLNFNYPTGYLLDRYDINSSFYLSIYSNDSSHVVLINATFAKPQLPSMNKSQIASYIADIIMNDIGIGNTSAFNMISCEPGSGIWDWGAAYYFGITDANTSTQDKYYVGECYIKETSNISYELNYVANSSLVPIDQPVEKVILDSFVLTTESGDALKHFSNDEYGVSFNYPANCYLEQQLDNGLYATITPKDITNDSISSIKFTAESKEQASMNMSQIAALIGSSLKTDLKGMGFTDVKILSNGPGTGKWDWQATYSFIYNDTTVQVEYYIKETSITIYQLRYSSSDATQWSAAQTILDSLQIRTMANP